jgi:hypothetical protein
MGVGGVDGQFYLLRRTSLKSLTQFYVSVFNFLKKLVE